MRLLLTLLMVTAACNAVQAQAVVIISTDKVIDGSTENAARAAIRGMTDPPLSALIGIATAPSNPSASQAAPMLTQLRNGDVRVVRFSDTRAVFTGACVTNVACASAVAAVAGVTGDTDTESSVNAGRCEGRAGPFFVEVNCP